MPIQTVNVAEVEKQLAELLAMTENGKEIVIAQNGKPIARLASVPPVKRKKRIPGLNHAGENGNRTERLRKLKRLFKETQSLPQIRTLSEDDISREIEAHRTGK